MSQTKSRKSKRRPAYKSADVELMGMTKKELIALAQERDILVSSRMRKAEIIEKIELK